MIAILRTSTRTPIALSQSIRVSSISISKRHFSDDDKSTSVTKEKKKKLLRLPRRTPPPPPPPDNMSAKQVIAHYGAVGVGVYLGVSSASFLTFLGVFASGLVDTSVVVDAIHTYTPVERWTGYDLRQLDPIWGNLTLAKVANVVIEPLRLLVAVSLTPRIGRWWRNERYERKQAKQEADELQNNEEPEQDEPTEQKDKRDK
jgi:hypothetical protein